MAFITLIKPNAPLTSSKWFWRCNYFITIYLAFVIIPLYSIVATRMYLLNNTETQIYNAITFNNNLLFAAFIIEWLQFPLCVLYLIFKKKSRTKYNYIYAGLLPVLSAVKFLIYLLILAGQQGASGLILTKSLF